MKRYMFNDKKLTTVGTFFRKFQTARLIKYSPERRCLFQVKIGRDNYFVKIYPKKFLREKRGEKIHRVGQHFWNLASGGKLNFKVPMPVCWDAETRSLWQKKFSGIPAIEILKFRRGGKTAFQIGRSIAQIAGIQIVPPRTFDWTEQMKDSRESAAKTIGKFPFLREKIESLTDSLASFHQSKSGQKLVPTHGDMHIDQWLFNGENLGLLDFEDFSLSDTERDLAFFAVQIESEYGTKVCVEKIEKDLTAGFQSAGGNFDKALFAIYKSHKWLAKAAKVSGEKQAGETIKKALECFRKI